MMGGLKQVLDLRLQVTQCGRQEISSPQLLLPGTTPGANGRKIKLKKSLAVQQCYTTSGENLE